MSLPDRYSVMLGVIRARMYLHFLVTPKGDRNAEKIFCIGHPRCGTTTLDRLFRANGYRTRHTAGDWKLGQYDFFSDFGQVRPFGRYAACYPNARFILNVRSTRAYIVSLTSQIHPGWHFSEQHLRNEILRRARYFEQVFTFFEGKNNLIVVDVTQPGADAVLAEQFSLQSPQPEHQNKGRKPPRQDVLDRIDQVLADMGLTDSADKPILTLQDLGMSGRITREMILSHPNNLH